jgi:hypothetical protein
MGERPGSWLSRGSVSVRHRALYGQTIRALQFKGLWRHIVRSVCGMNPPANFRRHCLESWILWGDSLRNKIGDDLLLIELLCVLMPKCKGDAVRLYRGDSFLNRCRCTYGLSWTSNREVARSFADGIFCRTSRGGSCWKRTPRVMRSSARRGLSTTATAKTNLLSIGVGSSRLMFLSGFLKRRSRNIANGCRYPRLW